MQLWSKSYYRAYPLAVINDITESVSDFPTNILQIILMCTLRYEFELNEA